MWKAPRGSVLELSDMFAEDNGRIGELRAHGTPHRHRGGKPARSSGRTTGRIQTSVGWSSRFRDGFRWLFYSGPVRAAERGTPNEGHVMNVLVAALNGQGHQVNRKGGARDDRGEDGLQVVDGHQIEVQVTMPTDSEVWETLNATGASSPEGDLHAQVSFIRGATVTEARALGLAMPLTERLLAMIEDLESGRRRMSWTNLDELVAAFRATR